MTGAPPLVSVIVVCWNSADVIGECLKQLLDQDYPRFEVIVVDDGSEDRTLSIAEHALGSGKVTVVHSPLNRGCPHARNLGLHHASGEIIAFIDADGFAARGWLQSLVATFGADETVGGVASTVFFADNPLVVNGAGGTANRQGWAADLAMNESYERAEIGTEVLYAMGCGMAVRRSAVERVGPFDDRMLNYYDDVDYGMRLWRAGYRVVIAPDAWIDHGFGQSGGDSLRKQLLCEQHRMRVMLKHSPPRSLPRWALHEGRDARRAWPTRRGLKKEAMKWNVRHLPSTLRSRWRLRHAAPVPERLFDASWGGGFPIGALPRSTPHTAAATNVIDMSDPDADSQLLHGWFPAERRNGRGYRWAGTQAAALVSMDAATSMIRLRYAHVPADIGGVDLAVRRSTSVASLTPLWSTHLAWQFTESSVENHPVVLPEGDYEVVFSTSSGWSDPPLEDRSLALALSRIEFSPSYEIDDDGIEMSSASAEGQLVNGWFEPEGDATKFRWAGGRAGAVVRLPHGASSARMSYRLAPESIGALDVSIRPCRSALPAWRTSIDWRDGEWHEASWSVLLQPGDYVVTFETQGTWSNPGHRDPSLPPDNRSLGFALSSLRFDRAGGERERP